MARPNGINYKAKWRAHSIRIARYAKRVQSVYDILNQEIAKAVLRTGYDGTAPFRFADYPLTKKKFEEVQAAFVRDLRSLIYSGTSEEWKQSNLIQDLLADKVLKFYGVKKDGKKHRVYYQTNNDALKAFQRRKDDGLTLSAKLWNQSKEYKTEMEHAISSAIEKGTSAVKLSKRLSKYLEDYPSLKKDYKEKFGKAVTCQDCEYRSIRLARSEINMAYRIAEQERWKQFDFVLGYEVKLTQNGRHVPDICDDLVGKYPKDFVFKGWHPNCMCYVVPILKTEEQFWNDEDVKGIEEPPKNFTDWLENNAERIDRAAENGTLPYWYTDNEKYVNWKPVNKKSVWEIAAERHAKRDDEAVLNALEIRRSLDDFDKKELQKVRQWGKRLGIDTSELENAFWDKLNDAYDVKEILYKLADKVDDALYAWEEKLRDGVSGLMSEAHRYSLSNIEKEIRDWIRSNKPTTSITLQESMSALQKFKAETSFKIKSLIPKAVIRPNDIADAFVDLGSWMDEGQKVDNILQNVQRLVGTTTVDPRYSNLKSVAHMLQPFGTGGSLSSQLHGNTFVTQQIGEYVRIMNEGAREVMTSINHLRELHRATDLDKIPMAWRKKFNKYIKAIESHDIAANGYYGIYREIEGAYNIYKLSVSQDAVTYGLGRLSHNTPYQIFEAFKQKGINLAKFETKIITDDGKKTMIVKKFVDAIPRRDFFDSFDKFVPFQVKGIVGHTAYYHPTYQHVVINLDNYMTVARMTKSAEHAECVFYHEFGHAKGDLYGGYKKMKEWTDLYDKYQTQVETLMQNVKAGEFRKTKEYKAIEASLRKKGKYSEYDIDELTGGLEDILQAMVSDHRQIGNYGHNYFNIYDMQLDEFIAHSFEAFWKGNMVIELFMPQMYKDMMKIMKKFK